MRHAGVGGMASAFARLGSDFRSIADHPQAKTRTEFVGMDVSMAVVVSRRLCPDEFDEAKPFRTSLFRRFFKDAL